MHVFRWDLDKTYLDTDFHSVRSLIRTALEPATRKRNIPGSAALMRALNRSNADSRVHIVSGSPTQMRSVLEEKLALDGVRYDELVLKDNLGNIRRGRLRDVRGQLGYKLPTLLEQRVGLGTPVRETLFGDDAEVDAIVYSVYAEAVAGRLDEEGLGRVMSAGGAYSDSIRAAKRALRQISTAEAVQTIFIHLDRLAPPGGFRPLGARVVPVFSWLQAALVLWESGRLDVAGVVEVARACADEAELHEIQLAALVQDIVRRGRVPATSVHRLLDEARDLAPAAPAIRRAVGWVEGGCRPPPSPRTIDFVGYLSRQRKGR